MPFVGVDIAYLGSSSVSSKTGVPLWEPAVPIENEDSDVEAFGPTAVYQALGVTSLPYPKTEDGFAECLVLRNVGGRNIVCVGGRDTRTATVVGKMEGGDTALHSTGPSQAALVLLKERKRQSAVISKTKGGKTMVMMLDGNAEKVQVLHAGATWEIDQDGDVSILNGSGCGFLIQGEHIHVNGTLVAGFGPPGFCFLLGPSTGVGPGPLPVALVPAQNMAPRVPGL